MGQKLGRPGRAQHGSSGADESTRAGTRESHRRAC